MKFCIRILLWLLFNSAISAVALAQQSTTILHSTKDILAAIGNTNNIGKVFDITTTIHSAYKRANDKSEWVLSTYDGKYELDVYELNEPLRPAISPVNFNTLDIVRLRGHLYDYQGKLYSGYVTAETIKHGDLSSIPTITPSDLYLPTNLHRIVCLRGLVRDATRDESDSNFLHLTLCDGNGTAHVMIRELTGAPPESYLGTRITAIGSCSVNQKGLRRHVGVLFLVSSTNLISTVTPSATFETAPPLESLNFALPQDIMSSAYHQTTGRVIATWGGHIMLIRTKTGTLVRVNLDSQTLPPVGSFVRVRGLPITDFYNLNLLHGIWEKADAQPIPADTTIETSPQKLLKNERGTRQLMVEYDGKPLRMNGTVRYLPEISHSGANMQIETDGLLVTVDTSSHSALLAGLELGCHIAISGICVMNMDDWNVNSSLQPSGGFFLVPSSPEDIVVLSRPSWWTPSRLMALLGIFAAALLGVIGWNVSLNRRARAKGKELAAEQLAHVTSELKVSERTRLAVELHDALSQTLTGVSMQIDTAAGFAEGKVPTISKCLAIASRTIDACRMELRNTLWDLRGAALDEPSMDTAIRKTLCQNLAGIDLSVRFNVPRETFSDNTAHAILKIIRELATNALRHGKATSLKIAGTIDDGNLLFSVRDNGCGFDPDLAPGISQGHFGLQGIAERLERLNGEMKIESTRGKGTKVTVTLPFPRSGE